MVRVCSEKQAVCLSRQARELKALLSPGIRTLGVFVTEKIDTVAELLNGGVMDLAQLHGSEDADYIRQLRSRTGSRSSRPSVLYPSRTSGGPNTVSLTTSCWTPVRHRHSL